jgi:protocatechuate 3,4-dioxygenase beta subunit
MDHVPDLYDQGLQADVATLIDRRRVLKLLGTAGLAAGSFALAACAPAGASPSAAASAASASATTAAGGSCDPIPEETAGPYPGDGSNGPDVLVESGIVRADIRSSFGSSTTVAEGVPLTVRLLVQDQDSACEPLAGAAIYLWHCDREGRYSLYSSGVEDENYLRGVQAAGDDGLVTFTSIFPACYSGRWPHIHFEVYPSLDATTDPANRLATSQIALPEAICTEVYATSGYEQSVTNLAQTSLDTDMVFSDGYSSQLASWSGSPDDRIALELNVGV